jgi:O-antigen ligase
MLNLLPVLFFFAVLMGSPVVGVLAFTLLGLVAAWQASRHPEHASHWTWQTSDRWLALSFMSVFIFKVITTAWSSHPALALGNAAWHLAFLLWPLVLLGLNRCQTTQEQIDQANAAGLVFVAAWRLAFDTTGWSPIDPGNANLGILAQLTMTMGAWNLLALTRPSQTRRTQRTLQALGLLGTLTILILSTRRLELLGFIALSAGILGYRLRRHYTPWRAIGGAVVVLGLLALLVAIRWDKFALGIAQIQGYMVHGANTPNFEINSWGLRLEMWRVGWAAFCDHPWLGISASARPSDLQMYGAPPAEAFGHRHFHMHLMQTVVEGGLLGLLLLVTTLAYSTREMIIKPFRSQPETALLAAALLSSYVMEGLASATLIYDKPNALLVVMSAWVWIQLRRQRLSA